jgi:hypothetical protein
VLSVYGRSLCLNLFRPFSCIDPKDFKINWISNCSILSVPDGGYPEKRRGYYVFITLIQEVSTVIVFIYRGRGGRDRMIVGYTNTCAINTYDH